MSLSNLVSYYDNVIRVDTNLASLFPGNVTRLYWEFAPGDSGDQLADIFPYVTWKVDVRDDTESPWAFVVGDFKLSAWDYGANGFKVLEIRDALIRLLERRFYEEPDGVRALRIWKVSDTSMSETTDHESVWRRDIVFRFRYFDQAVADAVNNRVYFETGGH